MKYIFDLDKTIWHCHQPNGKSLWAKEVGGPYTLSGRTAIGREGAKCILDRGVMELIEDLRERGDSIGFLSIGGIWKRPYHMQPSIRLLQGS